MSRSIFEKCGEALRNAPTLQTLVVATAPAVMMFMAGAGIESHHRVDLMTEGGGAFARVTQDGAQAYKAYLASTEILPLWDAIKKGVSGGYETLGTNMTMAGIGAMAAFPSLAVVAKVAAHISQNARDRFGIGKDQIQPQEAQFSPSPR